MLSRYLSIAAIAVLLCACAGTAVRKESADSPAAGGALKVSNVQTRVSPGAKEQLPDNIKFDLNALNSTIERAISGSNLRDNAAQNTLDVEVTNVYIRGTFSAVMFGVFAGADNISGNVRVLDPKAACCEPLRSPRATPSVGRRVDRTASGSTTSTRSSPS